MVQDGAHIIDINMDDALLDAPEAMKEFLYRLGADPEIARVPVMLDSSSWEVLETGLQCVQGKSVVNSISLKEGEEAFYEKHVLSVNTEQLLWLWLLTKKDKLSHLNDVWR